MNKRIYCSDVEADGLLDTITKLWCATFTEVDRSGKELGTVTLTNMDEIAGMYADPNNILILHNGISYDGPAVAKVLGVKVEAEIVDTMYLSWYLYPKTLKHGLGPWGEELGISKPTIDDWENLTLDDYINRCEEDVKIQTALWNQMWKHLMLLYGTEEGCWKAVRHLSFKARCAALQSKARWKLDVESAEEAVVMFSKKFQEAKLALDARMPDAPEYKKKSRPKKPFKVNGELSATGIKWKDFCSEHNIPFDSNQEHKYIVRYNPPNSGSHTQLKSWLYSLGWVPESFKYDRNKETNETKVIPQIKLQQDSAKGDEGDLCPSIVRLIDKEPAIKYLSDMSIVKHRISVVNGFINNMDDDGYVYAAVQGLTNTLRFKHKICVNIPSTRKPYGLLIRGLLTARSKGMELCGSDMSSLEDRTKQHYMWKHDPDYVRDMMAPGFDPHLDMALAANLVTETEVAWYKAFNKDEASHEDHKIRDKISSVRHAGKGTNYAATYGATGPTIARSAGVDESTGDLLHKAYWDRNWSLTAIAEECIVKNSRGMKWLWNPVAEMWFFLKAEKDRFSTLNQGTGTYAFDRWVFHILEQRNQLTAQFHDEVILELKKGNREAMTKILGIAMDRVNAELNLNRDLGFDVDYGDSYANIH
tara:strand:+ start:659 stop:2596 length:1938 start_codon:yes stop_codon:yes gene_type:complete